MSKRKFNYHPIHILRNKSDRAILLLCMGIAFVFWLGAKMSERYDASIRIALAFEPPSPRLTLVQSPPPSLEVTLKGTGWQLAAQALKRRPPVLSYALSADTQQVYRLQQLTRDVRAVLPSDISITTITPELIALELDAKASRTIPVSLPYRVTTAEQFILADAPLLTPDSVQLTGPATIIRNIPSWHTDTLAYEELTQSVQGFVGLAPYPNGQVAFGKELLTFQIPVAQLTEKILEVPIQVEGSAAGQWRIFPDRVKIICNLPLHEYELLQKADIQVMVTPVSHAPMAPIVVQRLPATVPSYRLEVDSVRVFRYISRLD